MEVKPHFVFPRWSNTVTLLLLLILAVVPLYVGVLVVYALDPVTLNTNYQPVQPVPYSHALHVGQLGMDCRYCHNTVERADFAAVPPTETCMNCHRTIWPKSEKLAAVRDSFGSGTGTTGIKPGQPVPWRQVTTVPDYVYFNHSAHVNAGVSCVECHGKVNQMEVVNQVEPMNMAWCLQCHRDPTAYIRPRDQVTKLDWAPSAEDASTVAAFANLPAQDLKVRAYKAGVDIPNPEDPRVVADKPMDDGMRAALAKKYVGKLEQAGSVVALKRELGAVLKQQYHVAPNTDCITCHR
jgi:menaquinone reductase, multiheme cytochrome c subunit